MAKPERILSTSVTITGTLLAIDAPVIASGSAGDGRFFGQWSAVAEQRKLENAWPAGRVNIETAYALAPDLIVVATSGADSALPQLAQLQDVAPTIVLDYGDKTWQALATELGQATGLEEEAEQSIHSFEQALQEARETLQLPPGKTNIISYRGPAMENPVATAAGVHGSLLAALGFDIEEADASWHGYGGQRTDFVWASYEKLPSLQAATTFLISAGDERAAAFMRDPLLANLPSVRNAQVYGLGENSFRIDSFSAREIIAAMLERFGQ